MTTLAQVNEDFDRIFGDTWTPSIPTPPAPVPTREATPVPEWAPKNGGHEL